jgi:hypothetical protein
MEAEEAAVGVGSEVVTRWNRLRGTATITKESRTHWTIEWLGKPVRIPKARRPDYEHDGFRCVYRDAGSIEVFLTQKGLDDYELVTSTRHKIVTAVQNCRDADVLRKVAELVGYKETP